jgi:hypothetical protein
LDPKGEEQQSLAGEREGDPIRTTGKKSWHSGYSVRIHHQVLNLNFIKMSFIHAAYDVTYYIILSLYIRVLYYQEFTFIIQVT